jgi:hypothetical protein
VNAKESQAESRGIPWPGTLRSAEKFFMTGYADADTLGRGRALEKPFMPEVLLREIHEVLSSPNKFTTVRAGESIARVRFEIRIYLRHSVGRSFAANRKLSGSS